MYGLVPFRFNNRGNNRGLTLNDMFQDFFNDDILSPFAESEHFKADIRETPDEYLVQAELPGIKKGDINIDYNDNCLTIHAIRNEEHEETKNNFIRKERRYGEVSRSFYVYNVEKKDIQAKFDNGVLSIRLPKREKVVNENNRIEIQ